MSKLYTNYLKLKEENNDTLLLFKSGIFHIFIAEDAEKVSKSLNLKLTQLNDQIVKCGFPSNALGKYTTQLNELKIPYRIVDSNFQITNSVDEYIQKTDALQIIKILKNLDTDNLSPIEALNTVVNLKNKLQ